MKVKNLFTQMRLGIKQVLQQMKNS